MPSSMAIRGGILWGTSRRHGRWRLRISFAWGSRISSPWSTSRRLAPPWPVLEKARRAHPERTRPRGIGKWQESGWKGPSRCTRKTFGNKPASGTEILKELGAEHMRTGDPIVYTSGDSVFQIAAHEDVIAVPELYRYCEIARKILDGPHRVGRVIARPFTGAPGNFVRTSRRHDYAVDPPKPMLTDVLAEQKVGVFGVGKIHDIYNGRGVEEYVTTKCNADGMEKLTAAVSERKGGLIFCNLVDFDMLYGHRKDAEGFAKSLEEFDAMLTDFLPLLSFSDMLIITADHGCDPDPRWETTDHSREYVPIVAYSPGGGAGVNLGVRGTLADMGQTIAENFGGTIPHGKSFLSEITRQFAASPR